MSDIIVSCWMLFLLVSAACLFFFVGITMSASWYALDISFKLGTSWISSSTSNFFCLSANKWLVRIHKLLKMKLTFLLFWLVLVHSFETDFKTIQVSQGRLQQIMLLFLRAQFLQVKLTLMWVNLQASSSCSGSWWLWANPAWHSLLSNRRRLLPVSPSLY